MRRPVHRPSTIDKLAPALRHEVDRLRIEDGRTIEEIVAFLQTMGQAVSRSAVGRHVRSLEDTTSLLREKREMAAVMVRELGGEPDDKLAELAIELIQGNLIDLAIAAQNEEGGDADDVLAQARTAAALAQASKTNVDRAAKVRAEELKAAAARVGKVVKGLGLTKAVVDQISSAVLGAE